MRILITGGSGLIGQALSKKLINNAFEINWLSRNPKPIEGIKVFKWDIDKSYIDPEALKGVDAIIHLAGEGIADKAWTLERKNAIIKSRTESIRLIYNTLKKINHQVKVCVSSGGIGYYGDRGDEWLKETDSPGLGFLPESCIEWENAVSEGSSLGIRMVQFRVGMVLTREGGALEPLEKITRYGMASPLGTGNQWISWIHIDDIIRVFIMALQKPEWSGIFNGIAPNPVRNREFTRDLAKAMHKPFIFPAVPSWLLHWILGEKAAIILDSTRAGAYKLENSGFEFEFRTLEKALLNLYPQ